MAATTNEWEYEILAITGSLKDGLNLAGKERWEAVSVLDSNPMSCTVVFKRPVLLVQIASDMPRLPAGGGPLISS